MSVFILAEMGVNHNGDIRLAKALIEAAAAAGADAVKTQTFRPECVVSKNAKKAKYQVSTTGGGESQLDMIRKLELSDSAFLELKAFAVTLGLELLSTPFDIPSVEFLHSTGQRIMKIPSGEITNLPYLIAVGQTKRPVILSTGMSVLTEIAAAIEALTKNGTPEITLLHCNTEYPTPFSDANLRAMETLKNEFKLPVGYSDHTPGIEAAVAAVAMGAVLIEKHFTLDKNMAGPDHQASLTPEELKAMVSAIRNVEKALGDGVKRVTDSERWNMVIARKSIIAARAINKGEAFSQENITVKRPGNGVSPMRWFEVLGKTATRDYMADELIDNV